MSPRDTEKTYEDMRLPKEGARHDPVLCNIERVVSSENSASRLNSEKCGKCLPSKVGNS